MTVVVPLEHKQIAYVAYYPEDETLEIRFHRGERRLFPSVKSERFSMLLLAKNKVDALTLLITQSGASVAKTAEYRRNADKSFS